MPNMSLRPLALAACAALLAACNPPPESAADATPAAAASGPAADYRAEATLLLQAIDADEAHDALRARTEALMEQGIALVPDFVSRHPHCEGYLQAAMAVREAWRGLDLETIEADYHDDGALPTIENAGVCYHMKDLFVHPATVLVILESDVPDMAKARREIQEVLAHASVVEAN